MRLHVQSSLILIQPLANHSITINRPVKSTAVCLAAGSTQYEVHVLSLYRVISTRPPSAGDAAVNIVSGGQSDRPIVLVFVCYQPVNWILT